MGLETWQQRLEKHFRELREDRSARAGSDKVVFGLEHGLDETERSALFSDIKAHIAKAPPSREHSLAWIAYASEIGYLYAGDEYWRTFEAMTPGWSLHGNLHSNRNQVRGFFGWFRENFGGAEPTGPWAHNFSIICWPITHAILPRDLQRQLARILYELRYQFSQQLFQSPQDLGQYVAARAWSGTARFQNFAQEPQLVGQIASALLLEDDSKEATLLLGSTLGRISKDLDRERRAREWLKGARATARERLHFRGASIKAGTLPPKNSPTEVARAEIERLGLEPRLILRPVTADRTRWEVTLEVADFSHLLLRFPDLQPILTESRCTITGSAGRPIARGGLLHGPTRVVLGSWPSSDDVLINFEKSDSRLNFLLKTECLLRPGPTWLFRVATDGLAYELRSLQVRPSQKYLLLTSSALTIQDEALRRVDLSCDGVNAIYFETPESFGAEWKHILELLGLAQAKKILVWPAGLGAAQWDGEGRAEWLDSEKPCLAIKTDHQVEALHVSLGGDTLELKPIKAGEPAFIELSDLSLGLHTIRITAKEAESDPAKQVGEVDVVVRIREARHWAPGSNPQGPMTFQLDPPNPTLEELWEDRMELTVTGPAGRQIRTTLNFLDKDERVILSQQLPPLELPVFPSRWRSHFGSHVRKGSGKGADASVVYDRAHSAVVNFAADELGSLSLECERSFTPVRWAVRSQLAVLIDDSDDNIPVKVSYCSFQDPLLETQLPSQTEYNGAPAGGLLIARKKDFVTTVVLHQSTVKDFAALGGTSKVGTSVSSPANVRALLDSITLWSGAKLSGSHLGAIRRQGVIVALTRQLFLLVCRSRWEAAEKDFERGKSKDLAALSRAVPDTKGEVPLVESLLAEVPDLSSYTCQHRVRRLTALTKPLFRQQGRPNEHAVFPAWLCEFALRLASNPGTVEAWAGTRLDVGVKALFERPIVARCARFLALGVDAHLRLNAGAQREVTQQLAGWDWE